MGKEAPTHRSERHTTLENLYHDVVRHVILLYALVATVILTVTIVSYRSHVGNLEPLE